MSAILKGAVVEIVDPKLGDGFLLPSRILVNGVDVGLVAEDGVDLSLSGRGEPIMLTLRLWPSRVVFRHEDRSDFPDCPDLPNSDDPIKDGAYQALDQ